MINNDLTLMTAIIIGIIGYAFVAWGPVGGFWATAFFVIANSIATQAELNGYFDDEDEK